MSDKYDEFLNITHKKVKYTRVEKYGTKDDMHITKKIVDYVGKKIKERKISEKEDIINSLPRVFKNEHNINRDTKINVELGKKILRLNI